MGERLVLLGGLGASGAEVLEEPEIGVWSRIAPGPEFSSCCVLSNGERLFALGGFHRREEYSSGLWEYLP